MKKRSYGWLALCLSLATPAFAQDINPGKTLFESSCQRCHRAGPASLKTSPEAMTTLLTSNQVRSHRFKLSEADVQAIVAYVGSHAAPK